MRDRTNRKPKSRRMAEGLFIISIMTEHERERERERERRARVFF
jgi:hypothetical protein